jgi:hypothetical protein
MDAPGSNPNIPETAVVTFREQWNKQKPGTRQWIAYLPGRGNSRLVVFPHREWRPPLGEPVECVLYPVRNAAVAAPSGGIPEAERIIQGPRIVAFGDVDGDDGYSRPYRSAGRVALAEAEPEGPADVQSLIERFEAAYDVIRGGLEELDSCLDQLNKVREEYEGAAGFEESDQPDEGPEEDGEAEEDAAADDE